MTNRLRKQHAHKARRQRHEDKRRAKREQARAYSQPTPKSQRRQNTIQFPPFWNMPVKQWTRGKAA